VLPGVKTEFVQVTDTPREDLLIQFNWTYFHSIQCNLI
jgi:hypothetical protein